VLVPYSVLRGDIRDAVYIIYKVY